MCRRRSSTSSRAKASTFASNAKCISLSRQGNEHRRAASTARLGRRRSPARTCCSPSAAGRTPTISASTRPASRSTSSGYISSTTSCARAFRESGRSATATASGAFTHTSFNDAEIVVANLLENDTRRVSDRIPVYGLFVDPPLGRVGMTEAEVRATRPPGARRQARHEGREARRREGRDARLHQGRRGRRRRSRFSAPRFSAPAATKSCTRSST